MSKNVDWLIDADKATLNLIRQTETSLLLTLSDLRWLQDRHPDDNLATFTSVIEVGLEDALRPIAELSGLTLAFAVETDNRIEVTVDYPRGATACPATLLDLTCAAADRSWHVQGDTLVIHSADDRTADSSIVVMYEFHISASPEQLLSFNGILRSLRQFLPSGTHATELGDDRIAINTFAQTHVELIWFLSGLLGPPTAWQG